MLHQIIRSITCQYTADAVMVFSFDDLIEVRKGINIEEFEILPKFPSSIFFPGFGSSELADLNWIKVVSRFSWGDGLPICMSSHVCQ